MPSPPPPLPPDASISAVASTVMSPSAWIWNAPPPPPPPPPRESPTDGERPCAGRLSSFAQQPSFAVSRSMSHQLPQK